MPGFGEPSNASLPQLQCLACSALRTGKRVGLWGVFFPPEMLIYEGFTMIYICLGHFGTIQEVCFC
jgi:hypothetical protein